MTDTSEEVRLFRTEAQRHAGSRLRVMPELPVGTYETVTGPVGELMLYRPAGVEALPGVFVNLHGGGFVLGDWEGDDPYCRFLADAAGCAVINLDYVLAPEHPYPAAVHQTSDLLAWLAEHGADLGVDASRLAVGGHSAGGNLAAAAALLARRRGGPRLRGVVVDYAPLELSVRPDAKLTGAVRDDPGAVALAAVGARFDAWYLPDLRDGADELASPALAPDLAGLPPTLVITAENDLLRAEGDRYAGRLRAAGVETEHAVYPGCGHGFTHDGPQEQAVDAWHRMAAFLRRVLTTKAPA
ncbi:alpha/beta hydrolase [uncultured Cellulomonas sp.]|uniref:alpha/beta hydrolase n=1 Tax=uncultured Cellulomonas sp. TaxID=189682 RepID=UPI0028EEF362|nr:alpha/beta hydrolase [uncultured Cellulomonas sp.]